MTEAAAGVPAFPASTQTMPDAYTPPIGRIWLVAALVVLGGCRLVFHFAAGPFGDETYYWLWGQHPAASYYDHPGANAWFLGLISHLGWNTATLRLGSLIATLATLPIFAYWARRLAGRAWLDYLLAATAIWLASPLIFVFGELVFSDYLLIFLVMLAAHVFFLFFLGAESGRPRFALLYLAAVILGAAGLAKYVAVFAGVAFALTCMTRPGLRYLLRGPHIYLAALIAIAMQAPTLLWNVANDFPSFRFHFTRMEGGFGAASMVNAFMFLLGQAAILSPALVPAVIAYLRRPTGEPGADLWRWIGVILFAASTGAFFIQSLRLWVYVYWNILAFVLFFPLAPLYLRSRLLLVAHALTGIVFAVCITANYALLPLAVLFGGTDADTAQGYGWPEVSARAAAAGERLGAGFLAGVDYQLAAELGFALHRTDVGCVGSTCHQFEFWADPARDGASAIVLALDGPQPASVTARFDKLEPLDAIPVVRFGYTIATYRLYLGTGFRPAPPPS